MIWPPIQAAIAASPTATALLGNNPLRFYLFGQAPQDEQRPYAVWQIVGGNPENYLNDRPDIDGTTAQIDVYAPTTQGVTNVAAAIRDAIEGHCHITYWRSMGKDTDTKLYRFTFISDWFTPRAPANPQP